MRDLAKYRIVSRGSLVTIKSKLSLGEQINEREINVFERQLFRGCFRPRQEGKKIIIYTAPDVIELGAYLKNGLEEDVFYQIIAQTVEMTKRIEMNGLYLHNLMLQPELVYISERTKELFFVYQPIISRTTSGNVYAFLGDITQLAIKNSKEEKEFLKAFEKFLNDTQNYKIEDIEKYIRKMYPQVFRKIVTADAGKSGFITNDRASYENHYHREEDEEGTTLLVEGDEGGTTLLVEDEEEGTTLLQQEAFPIFERKNTGESVEINKNIFTIGKENESDFIVSNNKAISGILIVSSKFEVSKRTKIKENFIDTLTDEQVKKINNAINKNDIETVLKTLEIIDLTNEGKKVVENSWNNFISSLRGNFKDEVRDEMLTNIFEASGATLNSFASFVNTATAIAKGPESASSFVVLNPNVADTTGVLAQYGSTLGKVATGCKIGLPILGGSLDFASMRKEGTNFGPMPRFSTS